MNNIVFYSNNGILRCVYTNSRIKRELKHNASVDLIKSFINEEIVGLYFSNNDIIVACANHKITLKDKENFIDDKNFKFIFDYIEKKKYKIWMDKNKQKVVAIGLSAALLATGITYVSTAAKANAVILDSAKEYSTTVNMDELKENYTTLSSGEKIVAADEYIPPTKVAQENDKVEETKVEEKEEKTTYVDAEETKSKDEDIKVDLGIGSEIDSDKYINTKNNYYDLIEKYATMYGVDPDIICAIATQERGEHSREISPGGGLGLMQIQVSVWNGHSLKVHNYITNEDETITFNTDKLRNLEDNIQAGCAIFQMCLDKMNGNYYAALTCYNQGEGATRSTLKSYSYSCGNSVDYILASNDLGWLEYRADKGGDPHYLENVLRYCPADVQVLNNTNKVLS